LVLSTVVLQLAAAWILDIAAESATAIGIAAVGAILAAVALNGLRFLVWGYTHRHFPLSLTYPLTALFFPLVLLLSWLRGEGISFAEVLGTILIAGGVALVALGSAKGRK
jgi:drug/metabolite transporter (DMT)-like permease